MKKVLCVILISNFIFSHNIYATSKNNRDRPGTAIFVMAINQTSYISIVSKKLNFNNDIVNINMEIPQIKGLSDKQFEKELNSQLLNDAKRIKKETISTAKEYNKDLVKDKLNIIPFELIRKYNYVESVSPIFAIGIFEYTYSGGAHGLGTQTYINIDTKQNKLLTLKDIFKEGTDYKNIINDKIRTQMEERKKQGEFFFEGAKGFVSISDNQPFYINKKGDLVIVFNVYEIAPFGAGIIEFTIPKSDLGNYITLY